MMVTVLEKPRVFQEKKKSFQIGAQFQFQFSNSDKTKSRGVDCDRANLD